VTNEKKFEKIATIDAGKAVAAKPGRQLREGEKPSAPANLVMPKPVPIPAAPTTSKKSDKK
jgi:hypothetical protein